MSARGQGLNARMLIPSTRGEKGSALQFEEELTNLDQLDQFRQSGIESSERTGKWMHGFSEILICPPEVAILRLVDIAG